jgi:hypothetical protein
MGFQKAVKSKSKLRAAMFGPSGAGKTYSALAIATGMGKAIALMDSERSSASLYADRFDFDQVDLVDKTIDEYVFYINEAAKAGYDVLIIDSLSHAWEVLNEEVQLIADTSFRGNFWSAWSKGTPRQRKLIDAIVSFPGHIIATMRSKTEWQTGSGTDGKKTGPVRVGLAPEQGKGIEYEFTVLFELTTEHLAHVIKDRTGKFQDKIIEKPGKEFGQQLVAWLNDGTASLTDQIQAVLQEIGTIIKSKSGTGAAYFTDKEYESIKAMCKESIMQPQDARLDFLQNILVEQKKILQDRVIFVEAKPGIEAPPKPAALPPPEPKKAESKNDTPSLMESFNQKIREKELAKQQARETAAVPADITPAMTAESEAELSEDDFDDDIPWEDNEKAVPATAELDIF